MGRVLQAADEKARACQEQQGHSHLRHNERVAEPVVTGRGSARAPASLERIRQVRARSLERRDEACDDAGQKGGEKSESKNAPIHPQIKQSQRNVGWNVNGGEGHRSPTRKDHAEDAAEYGKQNRLSQQLANHAPATCAKSDPRGELFSSAIGTSEDEVCDIGASNQENQSNEQHEDDDRGGHESAQAGLRASTQFGQNEK